MKCKICKNNLDFRNKTGLCKICYNKYRPKRTREGIYDYQKQWRASNPDKNKATAKRCYQKNRISLLKRARKSQLKRYYGITTEEYKVILETQNYRCAICGKHKDLIKNGYDLAVDHCHKSGKVRGLLCSTCNLSLGGFKDSEELLLKAIIYLRKNGIFKTTF